MSHLWRRYIFLLTASRLCLLCRVLSFPLQFAPFRGIAMSTTRSVQIVTWCVPLPYTPPHTFCSLLGPNTQQPRDISHPKTFRSLLGPNSHVMSPPPTDVPQPAGAQQSRGHVCQRFPGWRDGGVLHLSPGHHPCTAGLPSDGRAQVQRDPACGDVYRQGGEY